MGKAVVYKSINNKIPAQTEYKPSLSNVLTKKTIWITKSRTSGGTTSIYVVPKDKMFILLSAYLTAQTTNTGGSSSNYIFVNQDTSSTRLIQFSLPLPPLAAANQNSISLNFSSGLRFAAGESFQLVTDFNASAGIYGFETEDKDLEYYNSI